MGRAKKVFERIGEIEMVEDIKFCPKCGKEASEGTKFCSQCGYDFDTGRQKMQHAVTPPPSKNKTILAVIVAIILIGGIIGGIIILASLEIPEDNNYVDTGDDTTPEEIPEEEEDDDIDYSQYDDAEFLTWIVDVVVDELTVDFTMIGESADAVDFNDVAFWSQSLEDHSSLYLSQIDNYDVTPQMDVIKEEMRLAFQDCEMAGYYGRIGAETFDADTINLAVKYINYGTVHIMTATEYIEDFEV